MAAQYQISGAGSTAIAESVERGVALGRLAPGARVPPVRALAAELGVSLGTAAAAYRILQERGVLVSDGRRGTAVRAAPPLARSAARLEAAPGLCDLSVGNPDPTLLPSLAAAVRALPREPILYGAETADGRLLELAEASFRADGLEAKNGAVVHGALDGIERALAAVLRPGDRVAIEDPGYPAHLDLLATMGLVAVPVALDRCGLRPETLARALRCGARALIATPRAQNPTGAAFDRERRRELRRVLARHPDVFVIEDDYAWLIAGVPYRTLCAGRRRWFAVRSFSKAFGPDLRVAIACGDSATIARVRGRQRLGVGWVSHLSQSLARALWSEPRALAQVARASRIYGERRAALVEAFAAEGIAIDAPSGLTVWVPVADEAATVAHLRDAGFAVAAGQRFRSEARPAIRIALGPLAIRD
ncbi:MAG: aminotransferase class I/II-fold pyridoxal phosphate-dependent enzyme, partial [Vulcanimicrobiaceae bacterium]